MSVALGGCRITKPKRSQYRTLRRSPERLRKTKKWPDNGSWPRKLKTRPYRPSKLLRISTGWEQKKTRVVAERVSMRTPPTEPAAGAAKRGRSRAGHAGAGHR